MARPRYGYRRLHILLRREGWKVNHKKLLRLYREEGLALRIRRRKRKCASVVRVPPRKPARRLGERVDVSLALLRSGATCGDWTGERRAA